MSALHSQSASPSGPRSACSRARRAHPVNPCPPNLPSISVLFQLADSPSSAGLQSSLTLPPLRLRRPVPEKGASCPATSPSGSSSGSSSARASSPNSHQGPRPPKRKQVKRACLNCQKACKGCAETRPCPRCIVHGIPETCVDAPRKSDRKNNQTEDSTEKS